MGNEIKTLDGSRDLRNVDLAEEETENSKRTKEDNKHIR